MITEKKKHPLFTFVLPNSLTATLVKIFDHDVCMHVFELDRP